VREEGERCEQGVSVCDGHITVRRKKIKRPVFGGG
jgi:hypothetical protein